MTGKLYLEPGTGKTAQAVQAREILPIVSLRLPLVPSINAAFASNPRNPKLLIKTAICRAWEDAVEDRFRHQTLPKLMKGEYGLWLTVPERMRGDIDNRVKMTSDVLTCQKRNMPGEPICKSGFKLEIVDDDVFMDRLYVARSREIPDNEMDVTVVTMSEWASFVRLMVR